VSALNIVDQGSDTFAVQGELTFASIDRNSIKSTGFLKTAKTVTVDLSQVTNTDSAGLALMIEWIKIARANRANLKFKGVPNQLINLAKLSGFDQSGHFDMANI